MSSLLISLVVFGFAVYLFVITLKRIEQLEDGSLDARLKKEMESLIVEFNAAATRNITMLESKIEELQRLLQKANQKIMQLDERIERSQRPIVIEKIVEKPQEVLAAETQKPLSRPSTREEKTSSLSREEHLKKLLAEGKSREELYAMGFFENEINLIEFLSKNEKRS